MDKLARLRRNIASAWNRLLTGLMVRDGAHAAGRSAPAPSYEQLSSTLNAIPDLMFELDADGRHHDFRALRPELLVAPPEQLMGRTVSEVMPPEAATAVLRALHETKRHGYSHGIQIRLPTPLGQRWFEVAMARKEQRPDEEPRFIALSRDITERKQKEMEAQRLAFVDPLTGLPNRHLLKERLAASLQAGTQSGEHGALLFLDLDDFKQINDTRGHDTGDMLLTLVAKRLRSAIRETDIVARWGGDEFIVVIPGLSPDYDTARHQTDVICTQMLERLRAPYELDGFACHCVPSVGVQLFQGNGQRMEDIISQADTAMYTSKRSPGRGHVFADQKYAKPA